MKIVKAISKDINMNFGLENCAKLCLKMVGSTAKHIPGALLKRLLKKHVGI